MCYMGVYGACSYFGLCKKLVCIFFCLNSDTLIISILSYLHVKIPVRSVSGFGIKVIAFLIWECFTEVKHLN